MGDEELFSGHVSFASAIVKYLKGKEVEIYFGNQNTTIKYADKDINQNEIIHGKVIEAIGDCLVLECSVERLGSTMVYINAWLIQSILPTTSPITMRDICYDEAEVIRKRHQRKGL